MPRRITEEPQRETIRAFEGLRGTYVAYDSSGTEIAFLTAIEGATAEDIQTYVNNSLPDVHRVEEVSEALYRQWQEPRWSEVRQTYRVRGFPEGTVQRMLATDYVKRFVGAPKHSVGPIDQRRRQKFLAEAERERQQRITLRSAPVHSSVDPELAKLLDQQAAIETRIEAIRKRTAFEQHQRMITRREQGRAAAARG